MKTAKGLVEFANRALAEKWGYVYGTFGWKLTTQMINQKLVQYPSQNRPKEAIIRSMLGNHVVDCVGLIKAYLWEDENKVVRYDPITDLSANGMFNRSKSLKLLSGTVSTIPEIPGLLVWMGGHIGIYVGNGQVIEANYGKNQVVKTPLTGRGSSRWTNWCECPFIEYKQDDPIEALVSSVSRKGILSDVSYWTQVLKGQRQPDPAFIKIIFENIDKKL
jgi:hypothetical protein